MECKDHSKANMPSGFLLWRLTHLWQRMVKSNLDEMDLTHIQFGLLKGIFHLHKYGNVVTQIELANMMDMNVMMVSEVLRTLEKKKLVKRVRHKTDTRAKCVELTPVGEEWLSKSLSIMKDCNEKFFHALDEKEMNAFMNICSKLVEENSK